MSNAFVLKIFDVMGDDSHVKTEISNWNGLAVKFSRNQMPNVTEINRTGVYILIGDDPLFPTVYIGEGDPIKNRIVSHNANKTFWEYAIIFVSKDETTLNKTHIQYLECKLVELAQKNKKCKIDNGNTPTLPTIDEFYKQEAEDFLANILKILIKLNIWCFHDSGYGVKKNILPVPPASGTILEIKAKGIVAKGEMTGTQITVKKDSQVVMQSVPSCPQRILDIRQQLMSNKTIVDKNGVLTFDIDYIFPSLSLSAGVILGASMNGHITWKQ